MSSSTLYKYRGTEYFPEETCPFLVPMWNRRLLIKYKVYKYLEEFRESSVTIVTCIYTFLCPKNKKEHFTFLHSSFISTSPVKMFHPLKSLSILENVKKVASMIGAWINLKMFETLFQWFIKAYLWCAFTSFHNRYMVVAKTMIAWKYAKVLQTRAWEAVHEIHLSSTCEGQCHLILCIYSSTSLNFEKWPRRMCGQSTAWGPSFSSFQGHLSLSIEQLTLNFEEREIEPRNWEDCVDYWQINSCI